MDKKLTALSIISTGLLITTITFAVLYFADQSEPVTETNIAQNESVSDLETVDQYDNLYADEYFKSLPIEDLSQEEIDGLLLMREEEKLAHDVYINLYEQWGQKIFNNISESEQTHTDMVAELLNKYDIEDPVITSEVGEFTNTELKTLYDDLVDKGSNSLIDALNVGATVEDLDIYDLDRLMGKVDNEDILTVYQNLTKGSRNHIRAFTRMLDRYGESYTPQFISTDQYDEIISSPSENGMLYDSRGKGRMWKQ